VKTKKQLEEQRQKWRLAQQKYRLNRSGQKHRRYKEKDKTYRDEMRVKESEEIEARRRIRLEWKDRLARQREKLQKLVNWNPNSDKPKRFIRRAVVKTLLPKYRDLSQASKSLGLRWSYIKKLALTDEEQLHVEGISVRLGSTIKQQVGDFYRSPDVTVSLGGLKAVNSRGESVSYLNMRIGDVYKKWKSSKKGGKIGFSTFARLRPKTVKLKRQIPVNECVCQSCGNLELLLEALRKESKSEHLGSKDSIVDGILCKKLPGRTFHKMACLKKCKLLNTTKCKRCPKKLKHILHLSQETLEKKIDFYQWRYITKGTVCDPDDEVDEEVEDEKDDEKTMVKKHFTIVKVDGTVQQVVALLEDALETYPLHLFLAKWQQLQFKKARLRPGNDVLFIQDFAQNLLCVHQDEIQSAHWDHERVTIHPIIGVYECKSCEEVVRSEFVVLSDDLKHDHHAVHAFQQAVEENLDLDISHKITFSDGAASQYKSKHTFHHMASETTQHTRVYFGSGHGKSLCDASTGVFKRQVKDDINAKLLVGPLNAKTIAGHGSQNWAKETTNEKCTHISRAYIVVNDIARPKEMPSRKTLKGTRSFHCIKNNPAHPGQITASELACMCWPCRSGDGTCEHREVTSSPHLNKTMVVQLWRPTVVKKRSKRLTQQKKTNASEPTSAAAKPPKKRKTRVCDADTSAEAKPSQKRTKTCHAPANAEGKPSQKRNTSVCDADTSAEAKPSQKRTKTCHAPANAEGKPSQKRNTSVCDAHTSAEAMPSMKRNTRSCYEEGKKRADSVDSPNKYGDVSSVKRKLDEIFDTPTLKKDTEAEKMKQKEVKTSKVVSINRKKATHSDSEFDWLAIKRQLIHCPYPNQLQLAEELKLSDLSAFEPIDVTSGNWTIDNYASTLAEDIRLPGTVKWAYQIYGDGNCLPRCGSAFLFNGDQSHHQEIRIRIALELIKHQDHYLCNSYISKGWPSNLLPIPTCDSYMALCGQYDAPLHVSYNKEVNDLLKDGKYMGFFQMSALASVLGCPIVSVYPAKGSVVAQRDLHRVVLPRELRCTTPRFILWSRIGDAVAEMWNANHFVVLIPYNGVESATIAECSNM